MAATIINGTRAAYLKRRFGIAPYALYCLSADACTDAGVTPGRDLVGSADLIPVGAPAAAATSTPLDGTHYYKTPFTADNLFAFAPSIYMVCIARLDSDTSSGTLISNYGLAAKDQLLDFYSGNIRAFTDDPAGGSNISNPITGRAGRWALYGGLFEPTQTSAIEQHAGTGEAITTGVYGGTRTPGGSTIWIGRRPDYPGDGSQINMSAVGFFAGPSAAQRASIYAGFAHMLGKTAVTL